jgi:DNA-binding IclR family transcriptional regulator
MPIHPSPAVLRACDVLRYMAEDPTRSFTVSELARAVGVPRATCDAVLQALAAQRFVARSLDDRRYELGPGSIVLGEAARLANPVLSAAKMAGEELARALSTCVAVSIRDGDTIRVAEVFDFAPLLARRVRVGQAIPLVPPFGAVFVAWDDDAERWIGTADNEPERERYRMALADVRRCGYSVGGSASRPSDLEAIESLASPAAAATARDRSKLLDELMHSRYLSADLDDRSTLHVGQISAPVFGPDGRVSASLLVPGPEHRVTAAQLGELAGRVREAALRAAGSAGGSPPDPARG